MNQIFWNISQVSNANCTKGFTIFYSRLAVRRAKGTNFKIRLPNISGASIVILVFTISTTKWISYWILTDFIFLTIINEIWLLPLEKCCEKNEVLWKFYPLAHKPDIILCKTKGTVVVRNFSNLHSYWKWENVTDRVKIRKKLLDECFHSKFILFFLLYFR